jgi:hypothetical protein
VDEHGTQTQPPTQRRPLDVCFICSQKLGDALDPHIRSKINCGVLSFRKPPKT